MRARLTLSLLLVCAVLPAQTRQDLAVLDSLIAAAPDSVQIRALTLQKAQLCKRLYKTGEAISLLESIQTDDDTEVLAELADAYLLAGDNQTAADYYMMLSFLDPANLYYKIRLQSLLYRMKEYAQSAALGMQVLEQDSIPAVMTLVGDAFASLQDRQDTALDYYKRSFARQPGSAPLLVKIANLLRAKGDYDAILDLTRDYLAQWPDQTQILQQRGLALFLKGQFQDSIFDFQRALELGDKSYATYWYLGLNNFQLRRLSPALDYFKKAYQIDSSDVNLVYHMAYSTGWQDYKFSDEGKALYEQALAMMEPDPLMLAQIYNGYGIGYTREKDWKAAAAMFEKAMSYRSDDPAIWLNLARACREMGQFARAKDLYTRYLRSSTPGTQTYRQVEKIVQDLNVELFMLNTE